MMNKNAVIIGLGAVVLVMSTAVATLYISGKPPQQMPPPQVIIHNGNTAPRQPVSATAKCNDQNIAGKVVGGTVGGILGNQVGRGSGRTAATIAGALGGAYVGGEAIPLQDATCPH